MLLLKKKKRFGGLDVDGGLFAWSHSKLEISLFNATTSAYIAISFAFKRFTSASPLSTGELFCASLNPKTFVFTKQKCEQKVPRPDKRTPFRRLQPREEFQNLWQRVPLQNTPWPKTTLNGQKNYLPLLSPPTVHSDNRLSALYLTVTSILSCLLFFIAYLFVQ